MRSPVLGIDLGTTNSVVAHADETRVRVLRDRVGHLLTPSVVSFPAKGEVAVGHAARALRTVDAAHTVFSVKRLIGRPFRSPEVRRAVKHLPFRLEEGLNGAVAVCVREERFSLPEISSILLKHLRELAERELAVPCTRAVITVPANFNELQRTATRDAGRIAGLEVLRILNEPTAAALAYGYRARQSQRIAVYDFGGGTFDISILELSGDVIEVIATAGDTYLGGDDLDRAIAERMAAQLEQQCGSKLRLQAEGHERLMQAAEWIKCQLSEIEVAEATIKRLAVADGVTHDLKFRLTQSELRTLCSPLIERTFTICEDAFRLAGVRPSQLDAVLLVGGQTRTPRVREMVRDFFGMDPKSSIDPDLAVAHGAALQGFALSGSARPALRPSAPEPARAAPAAREPLAQGTVAYEAAEVTVASTLDQLQAQLQGADTEDKTAPLPRLGIAPGASFSTTLAGIGEHANSDWVSGADAVTVTRDSLPMPPATPAPAGRAPAAVSGRAPAAPPPAGAAPASARAGLVQAAIIIGNAASPGAGEGDDDGVASRARADRTVPLWSPPPEAIVESDSDLPPVLRASNRPEPAGAAPGSAQASPPAALSGAATSDAPSGKRKPPPPPGSPERKASGAPIAGQHSPAPARPLQPAAAASSDRASGAARGSHSLPAAPSEGAAGASRVAPSLPEVQGERVGGSSRVAPSLPAAPSERAAGGSRVAPSLPEVQGERVGGASRVAPSLPAAPSDRAAGASRGPQSLPEVQGERVGGASRSAQSLPAAPSERAGAPLRASQEASVGSSERAAASARPYTPLPGPQAKDGPSQFPAPPSVAPLLLDVTPHTLCVETVGGFCECIIERNAPIPTEQTRIFTTSRDQQTEVSVRVCQGESRSTDDNQVLGQIELLGLRSLRRGDVSIAVTFAIDADGTLNVRALDEATGQGQELRVNLTGAIQPEELARMRARQHVLSG